MDVARLDEEIKGLLAQFEVADDVKLAELKAKIKDLECEQPPAKAGGFGLRLKAGSIGPSADYRHTTVKSSSGSGGCWFLM